MALIAEPRRMRGIGDQRPARDQIARVLDAVPHQQLVRREAPCVLEAAVQMDRMPVDRLGEVVERQALLEAGGDQAVGAAQTIVRVT